MHVTHKVIYLLRMKWHVRYSTIIKIMKRCRMLFFYTDKVQLLIHNTFTKITNSWLVFYVILSWHFLLAKDRIDFFVLEKKYIVLIIKCVCENG